MNSVLPCDLRGLLLAIFLAAVNRAAAGVEIIPFAAITPAEPLVFEKQILPILVDKCTSCHDRAGGLAEGGLDLTSAEGLLQGGKHGPAAVRRHGSSSLVIRLASRAEKPQMPPVKGGDPLTSQELTLLKRWIDDGARYGGVVPKPTPIPKTKVDAGSTALNVQPVYSIDLDRSGTRIVYGRGDRVHFQQIPSGRLLASLNGPPDMVYSVRMSPDGNWLAAGGYQNVRLWRIPADPNDKWPAPIELGPFAERVAALDFSPDSKLLAAGGGIPASTGELTVWNIAKQRLVRTFPDCHTDVVYAVAFDPTGRLLLSGSADKFVKAFDVATGRRIRTFEGHTHHVLGVGWRSDGKQVASAGADNLVKIWDYDAGEQIRAIGGMGKQVTGLRWLAGEHFLAVSSGDRLARLLNVETGVVVRTFAGAGDFLYAIAVDGEGKRLASGGEEGKVFVWNASNGALIWSGPAASSTVKR